MLKVRGFAYTNETVDQIQKSSYLAQNTQITQTALKRNRVDTTSENNSLAEDSPSNLEPPLADTSNDKLVNYPAQTCSSVYQTDIAACNNIKKELG
ncbi:hypothetical protein QYM36_004648 [Artemia franciscana]|uniref:Uncharacterized protein n=1 Tax=Artemia franciscana TaxID=6661 RepID=A0AA88L725_ARTSF|nr:hypothetical protein QYM36_004648 [Artemia franciscana]